MTKIGSNNSGKYYKNTMAFIDYSKEIDDEFRRYFLEGKLVVYQPKNQKAIRINEGTLHRMPVVISSKNGLSYFGVMLGNANEKINPSIKEKLKKNFLLLDYVHSDLAEGFLYDMKLNMNDKIKKGIVRVFKIEDIVSLSYISPRT